MVKELIQDKIDERLNESNSDVLEKYMKEKKEKGDNLKLALIPSKR